MVGVLAAGDAAEIDVREAGARGLVGDAGDVACIIAELVDLRREWEQAIGQAASFRQFAESLNSTAFVAIAPDQKRGA